MNWICFIHSLPAVGGRRSTAGTRVSIWRGLRRIGALTVAGGAHVLPDRPDCRHGMSVLVQDVLRAGGDAMMLLVSAVDGVSDADLAARFLRERDAEYDALLAQLSELERAPRLASRRLALYRRRLAAIAQVDYFDSPRRGQVEAQLRRLEQSLSSTPEPAQPDRPSLSAYRGRRWVTAPRPGPDALACAWLIRRFIDTNALIRYADRPRPDEIAFDLPAGEFAHHGVMCAFERMVFAFSLETPALTQLGQIVHELDMHDGRFKHAETAGIDAALRGWRLMQPLSDAEIEARGRLLFDGAHAALQLSVTRARPARAAARRARA